MKRTFLAISVLMILTLVMSACAPATDDPGTFEAPGVDATEPPEPPAPFECTDAIGCVDIAAGDPIHIGAMLTISGATAFLGEDSRGGVEIAIADRGGTVLGHDIQFTVEDSLCSAEGGQTAATKITADPTILGVIGTNCSSAMTAAMSTMSAAGVVTLSPSNTAPALTLVDSPLGATWEAGYFRICHTDIFQGAAAADFAWEVLGATTAATIHDGSPYADQLQRIMADRFRELGGTVTFQGAVNVGDLDMRAILTTVAADTPDVLYFPIFEPEGPFIVAQSSEISGLEDTILFGADGLLVASFPENSGANAIGMYLSGPFVDNPDYDAFLVRWDEQIGGVPPSGFHAFAYDGTNILLDAIEAVAVVEADGTVHVGRQALRDAITATVDYVGLTGTLACADKDLGVFGVAHGDCATGSALGVYQITEAEVNEDNWPPDIVWVPEF